MCSSPLLQICKCNAKKDWPGAIFYWVNAASFIAEKHHHQKQVDVRICFKTRLVRKGLEDSEWYFRSEKSPFQENSPGSKERTVRSNMKGPIAWVRPWVWPLWTLLSLQQLHIVEISKYAWSWGGKQALQLAGPSLENPYQVLIPYHKIKLEQGPKPGL